VVLRFEVVPPVADDALADETVVLEEGGETFSHSFSSSIRYGEVHGTLRNVHINLADKALKLAYGIVDHSLVADYRHVTVRPSEDVIAPLFGDSLDVLVEDLLEAAENPRTR
jgi:hypothetical protein